MPWNAIAGRSRHRGGRRSRARRAGRACGRGSASDAGGDAHAGYRTVAFTIAVTTLAAKMAKADGVALPVEERAFERMFEIPPEEEANVRRLYDLAKQDVAGYEIYAGKIARAAEG